MSSSVSLSDLAEVDEPDAVAGQHEDVRRVRVAVEEAVPEDHRHPRLAHPVGEAAPLVERVRGEIDVRDLVPSRNSSVSTRERV